MKKKLFIILLTIIPSIYSFSQHVLYDEIMPKITNSYVENYRLTNQTSSTKYCIGLDTSAIAIISLNNMKVIKSLNSNDRKIAGVFFGFNDSILIINYCNDTVDVYNWINNKTITTFYASIPCQSSKMAQEQVEFSPQKNYLYQHYCGFPKFIVNLKNGIRYPENKNTELNDHDLFFDERNDICFINTFSGKNNKVLDLKSNKIICSFDIKDGFDYMKFYKTEPNKLFQVLRKKTKRNARSYLNNNSENRLRKISTISYDLLEIRLWDFKKQVFNKLYKTILIPDSLSFYDLSQDLKKVFVNTTNYSYKKSINEYFYYDLAKIPIKLVSTNLPNYDKKKTDETLSIFDSIVRYKDNLNNLNIYSLETTKINMSLNNVLDYKIKNQFLATIDNNEKLNIYDLKKNKKLFTKSIGKSIFQFSKDGFLLFVYDSNSRDVKRDYDNLFNYEILNKIESIFDLESLKEIVL